MSEKQHNEKANTDQLLDQLNLLNACRFDQANKKGHYESYFLRANHPNKPQAFWFRYTAFKPLKPNHEYQTTTVGELWGIFFDGQTGTTISAKEIIPWPQCQFSDLELNVQIGSAKLTNNFLEGSVSFAENNIKWSLQFEGEEPPLLLFSQKYYSRKIPKAKVLTGIPNAVFQGTVNVNGKTIAVDHWVGSQNHNWGSQHTDQYAWGQVAGFDNKPNAFLECSTARIKLGPIWSPWMTLMVLRIDGHEYAFNTIFQALKTKGKYHDYCWHFSGHKKGFILTGTIKAPKSAFVGLSYANPPGGYKICLNTKLASCELVLKIPGKADKKLTTKNRAAFEILTDQPDPDIPVMSF